MNFEPKVAKMQDISKKDVWKMFDTISPSYDFLNRLLSFGLDVHWRNQLVKHIPKKSDIRLLDLATGTGDQLITIIKKAPNVKTALGLDLAEDMLLLGQSKIIDKPYSHRVTLTTGDATSLNLNENSVDCVTMSFGIRNVSSVESTLKECRRVLTPYGKVMILEFSLPKNKLIKAFHLFYLRYILPFVAGAISRNLAAYKYLNKTIETFPCGDEFCELMLKEGFFNVKAYPLTLGIVTLYVGEKIPCGSNL